MLPSKSFYGQLLSGSPCNPTTTPRAFRSSGFNEPPFQLKLYSSCLLLICNASFEQLGPNRTQREAVRAVCLTYLYAQLKRIYTKWCNVQVKSVPADKTAWCYCVTLWVMSVVYSFIYLHMLLIAASLISVFFPRSDFLCHTTHMCMSLSVLLMLLLASPYHRSSSFYVACESCVQSQNILITESRCFTIKGWSVPLVIKCKHLQVIVN